MKSPAAKNLLVQTLHELHPPHAPGESYRTVLSREDIDRYGADISYGQLMQRLHQEILCCW
eukprot:8662-Prorocentrum_minimum.AAC.1